MEYSLVQKTLTGLKKRLVDNKLIVQNEEGLVEEMRFQFQRPATEEEIQKFTRTTGVRLPEDYQAFLRIHNGAVLFQPWFGGQFELYGVSEIIEHKKSGLFQESWYPIGYQDGGHLLIDGEKANEGENDYLIWWHSSIFDDAQNLGLNFELWLDRFVIAQGTKYWIWPRYTVKHYYRTK
ncbi:SMI1/KNR4 family protein [Paenactinomyces guangxiensis]|uniref:SMI1/KNR4 family protein n=1 Tax=Paenactinomyces guangxiensis TaxID=1490290 RepID=A0A7W1WSB9_9BACL|nr:SMI1/KNR4 family protein [Paenactinomyces guangxiensis]MBA4495059.1 SMI1/KNR4 family protein [Paenactinomyces guangxiensis]MBH8592257.1 SMI1/KNR4 family protein [Paenactinomyces guangxiensis]